MKKSILIIAVLALNIGYSQTKEERKRMIESHDQAKIERVRKKIESRELEVKERLNAYFNNNRSANRRFEKDGAIYEAVNILPNGRIIYYKTNNGGSSKTIKSNTLNTGGSLGLNLNGENMTAGVWDEGIARPTHNEFPNNKIKSFDGSVTVSNHSTYVTGAIAGVGVSPPLKFVDEETNTVLGPYPVGYSKGIASKASILASDWNSDIDEMHKFGSEANLVSNHSYGYAADQDNNPLPIWIFGAYDTNSREIDRLSWAYPEYQIVTAVGNDREKYYLINPDKDGYELITGMSNAKNVLAVAAVEELLNYTKPSDVKMTSFSNYGPTDDGRIKPNISAKGKNTVSACGTADYSYETRSGTSIAAPAITGSILLLQQHFNNLNHQYMKSATVRGLLQHTSMEAGPSDGPDYSFGWGLANIEAAAITISNRNNESIIEENTLEEGNIYSKKIISSGLEPLIVSISWTDTPSVNINNDEIDPNVNYLVNDLDIKVTDESGYIHYPWKLDKNNPSIAATKGDNIVDNFERIDIPNPSGAYILTISHKGKQIRDYNDNHNPIYGAQDYSLVVTGPNMALLGTEEVNTNKFSTKVYPIPAKNMITISIKEAAKYSIYEITGKMLSAGNLMKGENTVNVSNLSKGVYILKLDNGSKIETKKIIIE